MKPKMKFSALQIAILGRMLAKKGDMIVSVDELERWVYSSSGRKKPVNARRSLMVIVRAASEKVKHIGGDIQRTTDFGRGHRATFRLLDPKGRVREEVERSIEE
jgi:hypothetical protein